MDVGGAVRVPAHEPQQLRRGTRRVDGVLGGLEAVEPELALVVGLELAAQVVPGLVLGVEDVVFAVGARLPHVEDGAGDADARVDVLDHAVEEGDLRVGGHVLDDGGAEVAEGRLGRPEGAQDGRGGRAEALVGDDLVVDLVDEAVDWGGRITG